MLDNSLNLASFVIFSKKIISWTEKGSYWREKRTWSSGKWTWWRNEGSWRETRRGSTRNNWNWLGRDQEIIKMMMKLKPKSTILIRKTFHSILVFCGSKMFRLIREPENWATIWALDFFTSKVLFGFSFIFIFMISWSLTSQFQLFLVEHLLLSLYYIRLYRSCPCEVRSCFILLESGPH